MNLGDLVRLKAEYSKSARCGIVVSILVDNLVGVMWAGTDYIYAEPIKRLEVVRKDAKEDIEWKIWGDQ